MKNAGRAEYAGFRPGTWKAPRENDGEATT